MPGRSAELKGPLLGLRLEDFGLSPKLLASLAFGIRVSIASIMAFWIACKLQLDSPQWAMLTVWIVARPEPGLILSRAAYRLLGTVLGCVFGLMLVALFAQHPTLFVAALALLLGVCTLVAHLLTNLRSYAAVLAGYT